MRKIRYVFVEKALAEEGRAKASEEKFQKLKNMYTQIRDEHIKLLRQVSRVVSLSYFDIKLMQRCSKSKGFSTS